MEPRTIAARPDVTIATTTPRVTPTPPRASRFGEVLSSTVVQSAESAMKNLPGSPMMAVAVRNATGTNGALGVPMSSALGGSGIGGVGSAMSSPQGPLASPSTSLANAAIAGANGGVAAPATGAESGGIEASLQQSQDLNLYYLQIQEAVSQENRQYSALSNVLKAKHDTVKTAIGNIR